MRVLFPLVIAAASCSANGVVPSSGASSGAGGGAASATTTAASVGGATASGAGGSAPCTTCARDWSKFPPIVQIDGAPELWVLSDVHGDYGALTALLAAAKVIAAAPDKPQTAQWTAGKACLVVVGDLVDKGPDAPDVVRLMASLRTAAEAAGGHVVVTMGNHEAEFLADPENKKATKSDGIDPELAAIGLTPEQTAAGKNDIGLFIRDLPFAARVDDWFFVHAGNTGGQTIAQLSAALQSGVDANGFGATVLADPNSLLEARLGASGPQWWDQTGDAAGLLAQWTKALGVKHLVMGHQPGSVGFADGSTRAADAMAQHYGGLIFLVDTGMSVDVDATGGALLHVTAPGTPSEAWQQVLPTGQAQSL